MTCVSVKSKDIGEHKNGANEIKNSLEIAFSLTLLPGELAHGRWSCHSH